MTPQEITAHAIELGITRELYPELWRPVYLNSYAAQRDEPCGYKSNLPAPDSADPRACLWDGFYMRALGWPLLRVDSSSGTPRYEGTHGQFHPTPTAALRAAWLAKGAKT